MALTPRQLWKTTNLPKIFFRPGDEYAARCPYCRVIHNTLHRFGYCPEHQKCFKCKVNNWINEDSHFCEDCVCNVCWEASDTLQEDPSGLLLCKVCRSSAKCDGCGRIRPRYKARRQKKFVMVCGNCKNFANWQCCFCFAKGYAERIDDEGNHLVSCRQCRDMFCCFKDKCSPTHQCPKCQKKQQDQDEQLNHETQPASPPFVKNQIKFWAPKGLAERKSNRSTRFAGIELEISGFQHTTGNYAALKAVADKWSANIVRDGSLPSGGIEITTAPASGDLLLKQIDDWAKVLHDIGSMVNNQCGLHVHVDARDHTIADLKKLIKYYAFLEPALLRTQPFARIYEPNPVTGKFYCKPCGQAYVSELDKMSVEKSAKIYNQALKQKLFDNVYGEGTGRPPRREHYASAKYHAFNLHSYFFRNRKTVESRLHTGTIIPRKIKDWTLLWIAIVDHAYKTPESQLKMSGSVEESIEELLKIAPSDRCRAYVKSRIDDFRTKYDERDKQKPVEAETPTTTGTTLLNGQVFHVNTWSTTLQSEAHSAIADMLATPVLDIETDPEGGFWTTPTDFAIDDDN